MSANVQQCEVGRQAPRSGQACGETFGAMAVRSAATSGVRWNRITRYPAVVSSRSRAASLAARPLWLESSNSITATTSNAFVQSTKSATFRSKVFRPALLLAVNNAENATCARTTCSGNVSRNLKYIGCSLSVSGLRGFSGTAARPFLRCVASTAAMATSTATKASAVNAYFKVQSLVGGNVPHRMPMGAGCMTTPFAPGAVL